MKLPLAALLEFARGECKRHPFTVPLYEAKAGAEGPNVNRKSESATARKKRRITDPLRIGATPVEAKTMTVVADVLTVGAVPPDHTSEPLDAGSVVVKPAG